MLSRKEPLLSGRETEIDMIEREMEGGVVVVQPPEIHEHHLEHRLGLLVHVEEQIEVRRLSTGVEAPTASGRARRGPSREK